MHEGETTLRVNARCPIFDQNAKTISLKFDNIKGTTEYEIISGTVTLEQGFLNSSSSQTIFIDIPGIKLKDLTVKLSNISGSISSCELKNMRIDFSSSDQDLISEQQSTITSPIRFNVFDTTTNAKVQASDFTLTGIKSKLSTYNKIKLSSLKEPLQISATVQNISDTSTKVYLGIHVFDCNAREIRSNNVVPVANTETHLLESLSKGDSTLFIEDASNWSTNKTIAFMVKSNLSDLPNFNISSAIKEIEKIAPNRWKVTLTRPVDFPVLKDSLVRLHAPGGSYIYHQITTVKPGETVTLSSNLPTEKTNNTGFNKMQWPIGADSFSLLILSYSEDDSKNIIKFHNLEIKPITIENKNSSKSKPNSL